MSNESMWGPPERLRFRSPEKEARYQATRPGPGPRSAFATLLILVLLPTLASLNQSAWPEALSAGFRDALTLVAVLPLLWLAWEARRYRESALWWPMLPQLVVGLSLSGIAVAQLPDSGSIIVIWPMLHLLGWQALANPDARRMAVVGFLCLLAFGLGSRILALPLTMTLPAQAMLAAAVGLSLLAAVRRELEERGRWADAEGAIKQTERDSLTGLLNRRIFIDRSRRCLGSARGDWRSLALLLIQVDDLQACNDRHGSLDGDRALQGLAERLRAVVAASRDLDLAGRLSGTEFAVLINSDRQTARRHAELLRREVAGFRLGRPEDPGGITVSIGIAMHEPGRPLEWEMLFITADRALHAARQSGGNTVAG